MDSAPEGTGRIIPLAHPRTSVLTGIRTLFAGTTGKFGDEKQDFDRPKVRPKAPRRGACGTAYRPSTFGIGRGLTRTAIPARRGDGPASRRQDDSRAARHAIAERCRPRARRQARGADYWPNCHRWTVFLGIGGRYFPALEDGISRGWRTVFRDVAEEGAAPAPPRAGASRSSHARSLET